MHLPSTDALLLIDIIGTKICSGKAGGREVFFADFLSTMRGCSRIWSTMGRCYLKKNWEFFCTKVRGNRIPNKVV